jgi:hypothetical protein
MVIFANSGDSFSKSLFSGLPIPSTRFTQTQWNKAVRGCPFIVDAHGQSLLTAPALRDGNHNVICSTISDGLREATCPHLGVGTHFTCKGIFRNTFPQVTDGAAMKNINGIIPDLVDNSVIFRVTSIHSLDATIWLTHRR